MRSFTGSGLRLRKTWLKDPALQRLLSAMARSGGEGRIAGGAVRNALLGEAPGDIDIATTLEPPQVLRMTKDQGFKTVPTGLAHGTVTVIVEGRSFEVTTLRADTETDGRHAKVLFSRDWAGDARRRDFTINALYCDARGLVFDHVGGLADLRRQRLCFVGEPRQRIKEDYLRILRFFRFLARYGLNWADRVSLQACVTLRAGLKQLSAERISGEMFKLLASPHAVSVLKVMARTNVLDIILPHLNDFSLISRLPPDPLLRAFALSAAPSGLKDRWRLTNAQDERLKALATRPAIGPDLRPTECKRLLYSLGPEAWRDAVYLAWACSKASLHDRRWRQLLNLPNRWQPPAFPVSGHDLIAAGIKPGPALGVELQRLEDYWVATDFKPSKDDILRQMGGTDD